MKHTCLLLPALLLALSAQGSAQSDDPVLPNIKRLDDGNAPPSARASQLSWLAGQWDGAGLGGDCQESWLPPVGGSLVGTFRMAKQGEPVFFEFLAITEDAGSLTFRVKHFNPDITGWEEKDESVDFPLVAIGDREVYFDGLTLRRRGDTLQVFLSMRGRDGTLREEAFAFERVP